MVAGRTYKVQSTMPSQTMKTAKVASINTGNHRADFLARRNKLVEDHLDLAESIARGVATGLPPCYDLDDLVSVGYLGLIKAATSYRPKEHGNTPFSAYARPVVRGAIIDSVRRGKYAENTRPGLSEMPEPSVHDDLVARLDNARKVNHLRTAVAALPDRQQNVLRWKYEDDMRLPQVAERLGDVGKSRASQLHVRSIRQLRERLAMN